MIMEYCDDTLKSKFIDSEYDNPAKVGNVYSVQVGQMEELARYAMQICRGLEYLHTKKLVHRDMKLENILVRLSLALWIVLQKYTQSKRVSIKQWNDLDTPSTKPEQKKFLTSLDHINS